MADYPRLSATIRDYLGVFFVAFFGLTDYPDYPDYLDYRDYRGSITLLEGWSERVRPADDDDDVLRC